MDRGSTTARSVPVPSGQDRGPYKDPDRRCTSSAVPPGGALP